MMDVIIKDKDLQAASEEGMDAFVGVFVNAINNAIGNQLTAETMALLNADQITLLAYSILREEVMDGVVTARMDLTVSSFRMRTPFSPTPRFISIL